MHTHIAGFMYPLSHLVSRVYSQGEHLCASTRSSPLSSLPRYTHSPLVRRPHPDINPRGLSSFRTLRIPSILAPPESQYTLTPLPALPKDGLPSSIRPQ